MLEVAAVWQALAEVYDPEIPALSVIDLGLIRGVRVADDSVTVDFAPTFAGCPALDLMQANIARRLRALGAGQVAVHLVLNPPWTSDWITPEGRAKLKAFGLAPPPPRESLIQLIVPDNAPCPYCGSTDTELTNSFGPTLCRALYVCHSCRQPFEQFKAL